MICLFNSLLEYVNFEKLKYLSSFSFHCRAPLTIRGLGGGSNHHHRADSSLGGSEYSFPPSYRSRNNTNTPGTISSQRSIECEPSGRLLANEDIPEPLSVEQLSEYSSLQQRAINSRALANANSSNQQQQKRHNDKLNSKVKKSNKNEQLMIGGRTAAADEAVVGGEVQDSVNIINQVASDSNVMDKKDDLVTIVTITPQNENCLLSENIENSFNTEIINNNNYNTNNNNNSNNHNNNMVNNNNNIINNDHINNNLNANNNGLNSEQIEILAHL